MLSYFVDFEMVLNTLTGNGFSKSPSILFLCIAKKKKKKKKGCNFWFVTK